MKMIVLFVTLVLSGASMADHPAHHGMLVFGHNATYLSHLPLFHSPHDYQVILEVEFKEITGESTLIRYRRLASGDQKLFSLVPEPFDLTELISQKLTGFKADLFQGHFERGGQKLGAIEVIVKKKILGFKIGQAGLPKGQYVSFGQKGEYYVAHKISVKPSFDFIARTDTPGWVIPSIGIDPFVQIVPDQLLPLTIRTDGQSDPRVDVPKVGEMIGRDWFSVSGGVFATIVEVIYAEVEELSF